MDIAALLEAHRFRTRLSHTDKICLLVFQLSKRRGVPLLSGDICKLFSKPKGDFIRATFREFRWQEPSTIYYKSLFDRFSVQFTQTGADTLSSKEERYAEFCRAARRYRSTPLEIVLSGVMLRKEDYEYVYYKSSLFEHFKIGALRLFIKKLNKDLGCGP